MTAAELRNALQNVPNDATIVLDVEEYFVKAHSIELRQGAIKYVKAHYTSRFDPAGDGNIFVIKF